MTDHEGPEPVDGPSSIGQPTPSTGSGVSDSGFVVLVGPPSSGKTTIGGLLAERLGAEFVDIDQVIEQQAGKSISDIFTGDGEPAFRRLEEDTTIATLAGRSPDRQRVVSLGGGAVTSEQIRAALAGHRVVWLQVGIAAAADRIGLNTARPMLLGNVRGQLIKLMREREPLYAEVATISVPTDKREPAELVESIIDRL